MRKILPFLLGFFIALGVIVAVSQPWNSDLQQPIAFNHKKHVDQGLPCTTCHEYVEEERFAGIPKVEVCLGCHETPITESLEEEKIRQHAEQGEEIGWKQIYQVPDHVYFSHRRHVTIAGLECAQCHGAIAESEQPPLRVAITPSMETCMNCHTTQKVTNDCNACHR